MTRASTHVVSLGEFCLYVYANKEPSSMQTCMQTKFKPKEDMHKHIFLVKGVDYRRTHVEENFFPPIQKVNT